MRNRKECGRGNRIEFGSRNAEVGMKEQKAEDGEHRAGDADRVKMGDFRGQRPFLSKVVLSVLVCVCLWPIILRMRKSECGMWKREVGWRNGEVGRVVEGKN